MRLASVMAGTILAGALLIPWTATAEPLTFQQLYRLALERNEQVLMAREQVFQAERDHDRAFSQVLPRLTIQGTYRRYTEKLGRFDSTSFVLLPENESTLQIVLEQPLFSGGRLATGLRIARTGVQASREDARTRREAVLLQVAGAAYEILKTKRDVEIAEVSIRQLKEHRRVTTLRYEVGELTRVPVLRVEAELAGAEANRIRTQEALQTARESLRRLVDIPETFELQEPEDLANAPVTLDAILASAKANRPELARTRLDRQIAQENVKVARSRFLPDLYLEGAYTRQDQEPRSPFFLDEITYAGLKLTFPLFEGGLRRAELRQAKSRVVQAELQDRALEKRVLEEVRSAHAALVQIAASLEALRRQVAYAREAFAMTEKMYRNGLATNLDVLDANTSLIAAERDLARTAYDRHLAILGLHKSIGQLSRFLGLLPKGANP